MITRHARGAITWVDLESPTEEELHGVMQEFDIDARITNEVLSPTPYPAFAAFGNAALVELHFPSHKSKNSMGDQEVDLIVGSRFLITTHYEVVPALHKLNKVFETEELLGKSVEDNADALLELVMYRLYGTLRDEIDLAAGALLRIEKHLLNGKERAAVRAISEVSRGFLHLENLLVREEQPLESFLEALSLPTFFGPSFASRAKRILGERARITHLVKSHRATATELRETNMALLTATQNEVVKTLTTMAFITLPLTLVAALFQMNMEDTPIVGYPHDFWIVIGIMVVLSSCLVLFVVRKRWL